MGTVAVPALNLRVRRGCMASLLAAAAIRRGSPFWLRRTSHSSRISTRCSPASRTRVLYLLPSRMHSCKRQKSDQSSGIQMSSCRVR